MCSSSNSRGAADPSRGRAPKTRRAPCVIRALALLFLCVLAALAAPPPLEPAPPLLPIPTLEAARAGVTLRIEGVVTYCDPAWGLLFLQEGRRAGFIHTVNEPVSIPIGRRVAVTARASAIKTGAVWAAESYAQLDSGASSPPTARPVPLVAVEQGSFDSEFIETTGVLRPQYEHVGYRVAFRLFHAGHWIPVTMPRRDDAYAMRLVNARVRVRGVIGSRFDGTRRIGAQLFVSSMQDIAVLDHPDPSATPPSPAAAIRHVDPAHEFVHARRFEGRVIERRHRLLILQGDSGRILPVIALQPEAGGAQPAAKVTVTGFPDQTPFGRGLVDARVDMAASVLSPLRPLDFAWQRLRGMVVEAPAAAVPGGAPDGQRLIVSDEKGKRRVVILPAAAVTSTLGIPPGSSVEITGLATPANEAGPAQPFDFAGVGVTLLPAPGLPWETIATGLAALLFLAAGAAVWVYTLRRTVRRQVAAIEEARATLELRVEERTRALSAEVEARRNAEADLLHARDLAMEASRAKSSFLASMSHEFRTPLNAILGYSELLEEHARDAGSAETVADLVRIQTAARHLMSLVNDVLDLAKIESGKLPLHIETVAARELCEDVAATVKPLAAKGGNRLTLDLAAADAMVEVDRLRFQQSLLNLLSNACKFTRDGEVTLTVRRAQREDGREWVCWDVRDTGRGIATEDQSKLFQTFSQVDSGTGKCIREGTGLGLSITKNLCEMMGGRVTVQSELGQGSRFTIEMPAAPGNGPDSSARNQ